MSFRLPFEKRVPGAELSQDPAILFKRLMWIMIPIVLGILAWLIFGNQDQDYYKEGLHTAHNDLQNGKIQLAYREGEQIAAFRQYTQLLRKRHDIGWIIYSLPARPEEMTNWVTAYNEVMIPEIHRRFGSNVLNQTMLEAQTLSTETNQNR